LRWTKSQWSIYPLDLLHKNSFCLMNKYLYMREGGCRLGTIGGAGSLGETTPSVLREKASQIRICSKWVGVVWKRFGILK